MQYSKKEEQFLNGADIDYISLSELARISLENRKIEPTTNQEYLEVLDFLKYLINKYGSRLKCLEGPDMKELKMSSDELINWLKEMWYAGKYREIDYGVWFELEFTKSELVYFAKDFETFYKAGKAPVLDREQALSLVEQAKRLGVEVRMDKGHPNTFWDMEHLNIGPNGYHIPISSNNYE